MPNVRRAEASRVVATPDGSSLLPTTGPSRLGQKATARTSRGPLGPGVVRRPRPMSATSLIGGATYSDLPKSTEHARSDWRASTGHPRDVRGAPPSPGAGICGRPRGLLLRHRPGASPRDRLLPLGSSERPPLRRASESRRAGRRDPVRSRGIVDHQQRLLDRLGQAVVGRFDHAAITASGAAVGSAATMERLRRDIGWWLSYTPRLIGHFLENRRRLGANRSAHTPPACPP